MKAQAITIGGSDPSCGAGIQADLRTFTDLNVYAFTVLTSVTVQNSLGVKEVHPLSSALVLSQLDTLLEDYKPRAIKISLVPTKEQAQQLAQKLSQIPEVPLVYDPILKSGKGQSLFLDNDLKVLRERLIPCSFIVTPNLPELEALTGFSIQNLEDRKQAAQKLMQWGAKSVLVKGGHNKVKNRKKETPGDIEWVWDTFHFQDSVTHEMKTLYLKEPFLDIPNVHGTGCLLASAITSYLAHGASLEESVILGKKYFSQKIQKLLFLGKGDPVME
ncbi:MAG: bifunctional hydroxymethylpyrimidine kinase/phosphomethylpyrimidine kinase [Planctomycetota bacterium]|nr:MAG: bifunctional hydroxymethylpyrimidine kinase/phosphomethylpyrimidine kinase [Planctomycetota bacterium]